MTAGPVVVPDGDGAVRRALRRQVVREAGPRTAGPAPEGNALTTFPSTEAPRRPLTERCQPFRSVIAASVNDHCPPSKPLARGLRSLTPPPQQTTG